MINARILFGIASLLIAGCTMQTDMPLNDAQSGATITPLTSQNMPMVSTGSLSIGEKNAPVHMLLFTNYDCAYCKEFEEKIMSRLQKDFIETGKMQISIIPLPLLKYPNSDRNARLLHCGVQIGRGATVHTNLLNGQTDFPALEQCIQDESYAETILSQERAIITSLNVTLVPTYFINDKRFTGLPEYADIRGQIEAAIQNN